MQRRTQNNPTLKVLTEATVLRRPCDVPVVQKSCTWRWQPSRSQGVKTRQTKPDKQSMTNCTCILTPLRGQAQTMSPICRIAHRFTGSSEKSISAEKKAQNKGKLIDEEKHLVLKTVHPSPLSVYRGFYGCKHFSKTNNYLKKHGVKQIIW